MVVPAIAVMGVTIILVEVLAALGRAGRVEIVILLINTTVRADDVPRLGGDGGAQRGPAVAGCCGPFRVVVRVHKHACSRASCAARHRIAVVTLLPARYCASVLPLVRAVYRVAIVHKSIDGTVRGAGIPQ